MASRVAIIKCLKFLKTNYITFYSKQAKDYYTDVLSIWELMFSDESEEDLYQACISFVKTDTSGFPPSVGQINSIIAKNRIKKELGTIPTETEAWAIVMQALKSSIYNYSDNWEKLPSIIQRAVGNPAMLKEWAMKDISELTVVSSNFGRTYRAVVDEFREQIKLNPKSILSIPQYQTLHIDTTRHQ